MVKLLNKRCISAFLAACLCFQTGFLPFTDSLVLKSQAASWTGYVNADRMNVRSGPGTTYSAVGVLTDNAQVAVISETRGNDGYTWYQISYGNGQTGYARSDYIEQQVIYSASDSNFENWMNQQGFPESYKNGLRGLHQKYPNWVFTAQHTGLDWNTVITEESKVGRNLVGRESISSWKSTADGAFDWAADSWPGFDGSAWNAASSEIIAHYMDPRNFLDEEYIFQFEQQSYNASTQTRDGLMQLISGTFLDNEVVVPVNGSSVQAGTVIENNGYGYADKTYGFLGGTPGNAVSGSGNSSSVTGPGTGSSGQSTGGGPGVTYGPGVSVDTEGYVNSGPGVGLSEAKEQKKDSVFSALADGLFELTGGMTAYAAGWKKISDAPLQWVYENDDGSRLSGGWFWLDGNNDGIAECYYIYDDGIMAYSTTIDGYIVDEEGKWVNEYGVTFTKTTETAPSTGETAASASGQESSIVTSEGPGSAAVTETSAASQGTVAAPGMTAEGSTAAVQDGTTPQQTQQMQQTQAKYSEPMKLVSYADIIMEAAKQSGVSPYVIAAMILQEQGKGTSDSISGTHGAYPGIYNYFNLGAYAHDGMGAVDAGLNYAAQSGTGNRPWNTIEKSIVGGAILYGANYVNAGQDTFYLKKFNVQGTNLYQHQYMTNVPAAASEGAKVADAYNDSIKATALVFKIPVYNNMPDTACPMPTIDGSPNNKLSMINVDGYTLTPTFSMDTTQYSLIVDNAVTAVNVSASPINSRAVVSGTGTVALNIGVNTVKISVKAENGSVRDYVISITRRDGAIGNIGSESSVTAGAGSFTTPQDPAGPGTVTGPGASIGTTGASGGSSGQAAPSAGGSDMVVIGSTPPGA